MPASALALQTALFARLTTDTGVLAALGGPRVFDAVIVPPVFPYVTFGQSTLRAFDSDLTPADEHLVTLQVWSRASGRREVWQIIDAIRASLDNAALPLTGHRLVSLRHEFSEARRTSDGETVQGIVRFRALTEPL
jgi:hypothetical protein